MALSRLERANLVLVSVIRLRGHWLERMAILYFQMPSWKPSDKQRPRGWLDLCMLVAKSASNRGGLSWSNSRVTPERDRVSQYAGLFVTASHPRGLDRMI